MAFWIDTGTGTPTDPGVTAVIDAVRQYATEGGAGVPPSVPGAEWFNMMTDEVLAVLEEAGIAPDKASHTQLRDAIKAIMANKAATQVEVNDSNPATQTDKFITVKTLWGWVKQASETVLGMMKVATQTQTDAGTADDVAVTPKKLRAGFAFLGGQNGYIAFPTWLGGLIIQWGKVAAQSVPAGNFVKVPVTFPVTFPNAVQAVMASPVVASVSYVSAGPDSVASSNTGTVITLMNGFSGAAQSFGAVWIAFGI
ncbi:gp53-like domain-containing protein [Aeromonas allosaccharophila]